MSKVLFQLFLYSFIIIIPELLGCQIEYSVYLYEYTESTRGALVSARFMY